LLLPWSLGYVIKVRSLEPIADFWHTNHPQQALRLPFTASAQNTVYPPKTHVRNAHSCVNASYELKEKNETKEMT
jgi:hypothetical protein